MKFRTKRTVAERTWTASLLRFWIAMLVITPLFILYELRHVRVLEQQLTQTQVVSGKVFTGTTRNTEAKFFPIAYVVAVLPENSETGIAVWCWDMARPRTPHFTYDPMCKHDDREGRFIGTTRISKSGFNEREFSSRLPPGSTPGTWAGQLFPMAGDERQQWLQAYSPKGNTELKVASDLKGDLIAVSAQRSVVCRQRVDVG